MGGELMLNKNAHLSDEELVLFADGELSLRKVSEVKAHLAACWDCRTRLRRLEETIANFVDVHHRTLDPQLPPGAGPRSLLKARLAQRSTTIRHSLRFNFRATFAGARLAYIGVLAVVAALGMIAASRYVSSTLPRTLSSTPRSIPDQRLTPGAARQISTSEVCSNVYSDDTDIVPASVKQKVLQEYGMVGSQSAGYELDYLISPQLGGTEDLRNLWPEPASSNGWNMQAKDALENRLYQLVCQKKVPLATAQRDLATDWISAYKRYFHTDRPIEPL
jgi:hypothetical protein